MFKTCLTHPSTLSLCSIITCSFWRSSAFHFVATLYFVAISHLWMYNSSTKCCYNAFVIIITYISLIGFQVLFWSNFLLLHLLLTMTLNILLQCDLFRTQTIMTKLYFNTSNTYIIIIYHFPHNIHIPFHSAFNNKPSVHRTGDLTRFSSINSLVRDL